MDIQILKELKEQGHLPARSLNERLVLGIAMELAQAVQAKRKVWQCMSVNYVSLFDGLDDGD